MSTTTRTEERPRAVLRKDYRPPSYWVDTVDLRFELGEDETLVESRLVLGRNLDAEPRQEDLHLHGESLELRSIRMDGEELDRGSYRVDEEGLTLRNPPDEFVLETTVAIRPHENTRLQGLYQSNGTYCTQCEAEGFRRITYMLDRPDVMARYTSTIVADAGRCPVMLSNGNRAAEGELEDGRRWVRWEDPYKKPSYLFALVAGDLRCLRDRYETRSGRGVELEIWVEPADLDKCEHAMRSLKEAMEWDERVFGLEYDLDNYMIVAVPDFNMGAMENKGLNIFNTKYVLARTDTATDDDFAGIQGVIGHEYFHNWTGNRVTCRDWFQLSLKEGLTVYRDQRFSGAMTSEAVKRIDDVNFLRTRQFPEDDGPMAHPVRPESYIEMNNFYTVTVYYKGAEVVRMYERLFGRDGFRRGMDLYFERHDGEAVTCDDFRAAMADANDADLAQFERWYDQAGTPVVRVQGSWDAGARTYTLEFEQDCPATPGQEEKLPFLIPLQMGLIGPGGEEMPLRLEGEEAAQGGDRVLVLRERRQRFVFQDVDREPVPSLLRDFSAPVKVEARRSRADLALLMAHDSDGFNRWESGQQLAQDVLLELVAEVQAGGALALDPVFVEAFGAVLESPSADRSLQAQALRLPGESYLAEQVEVVDVEAIHRARRFARRELAARLRPSFEHAEQENRAALAAAPDSLDQESVGRRRMQNLSLAYLACLEEPDRLEQLARQAREAGNMTDVLAALGVLSDLDVAEREEALARFHDTWQDDPLVLDKWFSIQALSSLPDTLERVRKLLDHPKFSLRNPNKVRALIGAFAMSNPLRFHAADGSGYRFLVDQLLELDSLNPQIAARLTGAFGRWHRFPAEQRSHARRELERLAAKEGLSKDVYEIVTKTLELAERG